MKQKKLNSVESDRLLTIRCLEHSIVLLGRLVGLKVQIVVSFYQQVSGVLLTRVAFLVIIIVFCYDLFSKYLHATPCTCGFTRTDIEFL